MLLTDITYLPFGRHSEFAYLSTILDGSTGELLAYNLSNRINLSLATVTIKHLMKQRRLKLHKDAFIHSDQGSHYTSPTYQELPRKKGLGQSMSRRRNCWDNDPHESFYGHMKDHVKSRECGNTLLQPSQISMGIKKDDSCSVQESTFVGSLTLFSKCP